MASKTIGKVSKQVSGLGKAGATASRGLSNLGANLAKLGAVAAVGLGVAVKSGLSSLAELESAVASVDGAIKQMGLTGTTTGAQVATWANEIEANVGAAFDDKAITQATSTLIRFGKVTPGNLRPAMQVITDLATKTGDVDSAATLLAKALADPTKAAGKLARSGVILTKAEQDQIKAFVKAGEAAKAQKVILDSLAKTTTGAALASQGPYKRALATLADVTEDAQRALAEGFLPVLEKVAAKLSKGLADPKVMANIREFGKGLASGLDSLISIAEKLPWATIGDSLKLAGAGAKAVLGVFTAMPPWVQTAVLTGWGLNKLTGGAIGSLVGQLAGGLIKGVLGITAGIVNVTGPVAGLPGGGAGAVPGVAAKGAGRLGAIASGIAKVTIVGMAAGVAVALAKELADQSGAIREQGKGVVEQAKNFGNTGSEAAIVAAINSIDEQAKSPLNAMALAITNPLNGGLDALRDTRMSLVASLNTLRTATAAGDTRVAGRIDSMTAAVRAIKIAPVINVSTYPQITIRNVATANRIASAVDVRKGTGGGKIYEP
jgi:hypothetical protein